MPVRSVALAFVLSASAAFAAETPPIAPLTGRHWSVATGETVSPDRDAISFELGWPGVTFGYLHGLSDRSDLGFKIDLLYSLENTNTSVFGAGADLPLRVVVNRQDKVSLGLHVDPGIRIYTRSNFTDFLTRFPVGGTLGVQALPELRIAASADLVMAINWTHTAYFEVGPQFGLAGEYAVDRNLLVGLRGTFGPQFYSVSGSGTDFAFTMQVVVGYRM